MSEGDDSRAVWCGTWVLDAARSRYEHGAPPQRGIYRIAPIDGGLRFDVDGADGEGQPIRIAYEARFGATGPVETVLVDARTLDTLAPHAPPGKPRHARRVLSADGATMTIVQSGIAPDGAPFSNESVYVRADG